MITGALIVGIGIGWWIAQIKTDTATLFYHFSVWEQAKSKKLHVIPLKRGGISVEQFKDGIIIQTE